MNSGFRTTLWSLALAALAACSSGGGSAPTQVVSAVQDLDADPDGTTLVLTFDGAPGPLGNQHFAGSAGQSATSVSVAGNVATVTFAQRVSPAHQVRVVNTGNVSDAWRAVSTTDASAPTFTVTDGQQDTSDNLLGGDTLELTFSGPRVVEADAEDVGNWLIKVGPNYLDLTGSTFDLDPATQVLTATLGAGANLHANFQVIANDLGSVADTPLAQTPVAGTATGDAAAPSLVSVEQRLVLAANGTIVDFVFDEPMDPIASPRIANFTVDDHADAVGSTLTANVSTPDDQTLRVTFAAPVVPGLDTIDLSGIVDAHGNALAVANTAIGNAEATANSYTSVTGTTTEGTLGDTIEIVTAQALDPDLAVLPARWSIDVDGSPLTMADQTLSYDLSTRTLTVELDFDMDNGDTVDVTSVGQVDIDGDTFSAAATQVNAGGDVGVPTISSVVQNRTADSTGMTLDVGFSEDVDPVTAEDASHYDIGAGMGTNITSATVLGNGSTVRVVTTNICIPGTTTLTVDGDVEDLAGNTLAGLTGPLAVTSTDTTSPSIGVASALALAGADNDQVVVTFDDDMLAPEVETLGNWTLESPIGTSIPLSAETVDYDTDTRIVVLTLDGGGQSLVVGDDFRVTLGTMRDVAGNTITATPATGTVTGEGQRPFAHTVWRDDSPSDDVLELRFSEPCGPFDDVYHPSLNAFGTQFFAVRTSGGFLRGYPTSAASVDGGLGVRLTYGFVIDLTDTLDVAGCTDLAGNTMFASEDMDVVAKDVTAPVQVAVPVVTAVSGENNDTVVVDFNVPMSPWQITNKDNYRLQTQPGGVDIDLTGATLSWDGGTTVTFDLTGAANVDLDASETYRMSLLVTGDPVTTSQGVVLAGQDDQDNTVTGDTTQGPLQGSSLALVDTTDPNSVLVVFSEAVDETAAEVAGNYDLNSGNLATGVTLLSPRVVRATFGVAVNPADTLDIAQASSQDLAGNQTAGGMTLAVATDANPPTLASVAGVVGVGTGGDVVRVTFSEQVDLATALDRSHYAVTNGGALDLTSASLSWDSPTATVTIALSQGIDLDPALAFTVTVSGVQDAAGNVMPAPVMLGGSISGDGVAPTITGSFVNYAQDGFGSVIDVAFSEAVDPLFVTVPGNWSTSGTPTVTGVTVLADDHVRVTLDSILSPGELLQVDAGLEDLAGNATVSILTTDPFDGLE